MVGDIGSMLLMEAVVVVEGDGERIIRDFWVVEDLRRGIGI